MQKCTECDKVKPSSEFRIIKNSCGKTWQYHKCILCERVFDQERKHTAERRYTRYKMSAKNRNRIFDLTLEEFKKITSKRCTYCNGYSNTELDEKFCGIDRIDPNKDYTVDNMTPCCDICNYMKKSLTREEFSKHIKNIYKYMFKRKKKTK